MRESGTMKGCGKIPLLLSGFYAQFSLMEVEMKFKTYTTARSLGDESKPRSTFA
jgi:hypothetical protein